jgi:hypothetical protein
LKGSDEMRVNLIKRGKVTHVGFKAKVMGEVNLYSLCNQRWSADDKVSEGEDTEVTCKRCIKKMSKADKDGYVKI